MIADDIPRVVRVLMLNQIHECSGRPGRTGSSFVSEFWFRRARSISSEEDLEPLFPVAFGRWLGLKVVWILSFAADTARFKWGKWGFFGAFWFVYFTCLKSLCERLLFFAAVGKKRGLKVFVGWNFCALCHGNSPEYKWNCRLAFLDEFRSIWFCRSDRVRVSPSSFVGVLHAPAPHGDFSIGFSRRISTLDHRLVMS
jgi:hypothetical protein